MTTHLLCTALLLFVPGAEEAKEGKYPHAELLIDAGGLAKGVQAKSVQVLDARPKAKYDAAHVPGALWVDSGAWSKAFGGTPDKEAWTNRLGALGLKADAPVVVYGDDPREPARVWWILRYWGFKEVRLLDGGWLAWASANSAASKEAPPVTATTPKLTAHPERLATKEQVLDFVKDKDRQIIDARSGKEHCGEEKLAKRGGSIPGAKNLEWSDLLDKDGRFKSADDLRALFKEHDVNLKEPAVTYCQSGGRASVMVFALELMGAKDVRNYYRSWNEWGNDPDTPIVTPKKKE
ncbi:MAG TPA: sulfurtransferase [Gemmataceae bacterium]|nr:sulfurtransferase [Gemmataceae bacterium]